MLDPSVVEEYYDLQFSEYIMPLDYKNARVNIFCQDCEKTSIAPFHIMGAKCIVCRSYNTTRDKGEIFYVTQEMAES